MTIFKTRIKIHSLINDTIPPEKYIGIEIIQKSFASYQITPASLSIEEARELRSLLDKAIGD